MRYVIGSFNLRDFNFANQSTDNVKEKQARDLDRIAKIILQEKFDVIALQEINAELALKRLTAELNKCKTPMREYAYNYGPINLLHSSRDPERYGFIWNTKRLRLTTPRRGENPGCYQSAGAVHLLRPPYYGRFTARGLLGGANFELRIVNTHIKFKGPMQERLDEFNILVQQVLPRICDHQEVTVNGEIIPAYTFLVGDYNLELNQKVLSIYGVQSYTDTSYTGRRRSYRTVQEEPTSLQQPKEQHSIGECYASNYDHFTYEDCLDRKLTLVPQRVEALTKYYPEYAAPADKLAGYRKGVSDHVPIKLTVDFKAGNGGTL